MSRKGLKFFIVLTFLFLAGTILYLLTPAPHRDYPEGNNNKNPSAGNERSFRIGVSLPLTGDNAEPAMMQKNAYKLWE